MAFDRDRFVHDVKAARSQKRFRAPDDDFELRFVLEGPPGMKADSEALRGAAGELLGIGGGDLVVTPLFGADAPVFDGGPDLRAFQLLTVPEVPLEAMTQSVFDIGYALGDGLKQRSTEPDLPTGVPVVDSSDGGFCSVPEDLASRDYGWALRAMRVDQAWRVLEATVPAQARGEGTRIGHPDTGWARHFDMNPVADGENIDRVAGWDFYQHRAGGVDPLDYPAYPNKPGHGLATGSVIVSRGGLVAPPTGEDYGGTTGPGRITGVAHGATLVPLRAIRSVVRLSQARVAQAVEHARRVDCHVISMSLGGVPSRALRAAIDSAIHQGVIVVAAAGNCFPWVVWPARYGECIAVAATDQHDAPWRFSARGSRVDIAAPGENVWRARRWSPEDPEDLVAPGQGTSFAAAQVAGIAALWLARHGGRDRLWRDHFPQSSPQALFKSMLKRTARVPRGWDQRRYGAGIVDAERLVSEPLAASLTELAGLAFAPRRDPLAEIKGFLDEVPGFADRPELKARLANDEAGLARFGLELAQLVHGGALLGLADRDAPEQMFARIDRRGPIGALGPSDGLRAWLEL